MRNIEEEYAKAMARLDSVLKSATESNHQEPLRKAHPESRSASKGDQKQPVPSAQQSTQPQVTDDHGYSGLRPGESVLSRSLGKPRSLDGMTGKQLIAMRAGLDPDTPGIENMTFEEMKEFARRKQEEEVVKPLRRLYGLPDPVERPRNYVIPSY